MSDEYFSSASQKQLADDIFANVITPLVKY